MLEKVLEWLYSHEINVDISSFWDGGWKVRLGDAMNGYGLTSDCLETEEIAQAVMTLALEAYPKLMESALPIDAKV